MYTLISSKSVHTKYFHCEILKLHFLDERFCLWRRVLGFPHGFNVKEGEPTIICGVFSVELPGLGDAHGS